MIGLIKRGMLPDAIQEEFENLVARLREIFLKEHNEDGTHITADRLLNVVPVGAVNIWSTDSAPTGWLLCRGQQVSRLTYKGLFDVVGTTYGAGDGSTTFNVPDLQQRFPLGKAAAGTGSALAGTGGAIDHTHTTPAHSHTVSGSTAATAVSISGSTAAANAPYEARPTDGHHHLESGGGSTGGNVGSSDMVKTDHTHNVGSLAGASHSHGAGTLAVDSIAAGTSGTNNPPYLVINYIIFAGV
jgi:microcystin-dependent protein